MFHFVSGLGAGVLPSAPVVIIYDYFEKYKSLASGIALCGYSLSALFMVGILRFSIDYYGWRGAMLIMAGLALNGCVMAMFFLPNTLNKPKPRKLKQELNLSLFRNANFMLFVISYILICIEMDILYQLSASRAVSRNMSKLQGSALMICLGVASTISRFIFSAISNMKCASHIGVYFACSLGLCGMVFISCFVVDSFIGVALCAVGSGLAIGKIISPV